MSLNLFHKVFSLGENACVKGLIQFPNDDIDFVELVKDCTDGEKMYYRNTWLTGYSYKKQDIFKEIENNNIYKKFKLFDSKYRVVKWAYNDEFKYNVQRFDDEDNYWDNIGKCNDLDECRNIAKREVVTYHYKRKDGVKQLIGGKKVC